MHFFEFKKILKIEKNKKQKIIKIFSDLIF